MVVFLLVLLTLLGTLISVFDIKDEIKKGPSFIKKVVLPILYLISLIISIVVIVYQNYSADQMESTIFGIEKSVSGIQDTASKQLEKAEVSLENVKQIRGRTDSVVASLDSLLSVQQDLILQYKKVNVQLSEQLRIELKNKNVSQPFLDLLEENSGWTDTISNRSSAMLEFAIGNLGGRNCLVKLVKGSVLFFNKQHGMVYRHNFEDIDQDFILEPFDLKQKVFVVRTFPIVNYRDLMKKTDYAVARIDIQFEDLFTSKTISKTIYASWYARPNSVQHALKWSIDRYSKSEKNTEY